MEKNQKEARGTQLDSGRVPFRVYVDATNKTFEFDGFKVAFPTNDKPFATIDAATDPDEMRMNVRGACNLAGKNGAFDLVTLLDVLITRGIECPEDSWDSVDNLSLNQYAISAENDGESPYTFRAKDDAAARGIQAAYLAGAGRFVELGKWASSGGAVVKVSDGRALAKTDLIKMRSEAKPA